VIFAVVSLNLAVGVAAWIGEHRIAEHASSLYDDAFAAAAHIQKSELSFERFVAARAAPTHHWGDEAADDLLATSADELQVAIEHTPSLRERWNRRSGGISTRCAGRAPTIRRSPLD
jgi:hypothetical protein